MHEIAHPQEVAVKSNVHPIEYWQEYSDFKPAIQPVDNCVEVAPWMMVNWPYYDNTSDMAGILEHRGIPVTDRFDINGYTSVGKEIYGFGTTTKEDFDSWGWYAISRSVPNRLGELASILVLDREFLDAERYEEVIEAKRAIRRALGETAFCMTWGNEQYRTNFRCCHTPDFENISKEWAVVNRYRHLDLREMRRPVDDDQAVSRLLEQMSPTDIDCLYKNDKSGEYSDGLPTIILFTGPSGAGKDILINELERHELVSRVKVATNRPMRVSGPDSDRFEDYVWMRLIKRGETTEQYSRALQAEYGLLEHGYHNGSFYGLPESSIRESLDSYSRPLAFVTDNIGARKVKEIFRGECNVVSVFITPDSVESLGRRIAGRDNFDQRIAEATDLINDGADSDYCLVNRDGWNGYRKSFHALKSLATGGLYEK